MAEKKSVGYSDTPFLPGDKWRVHDGERPQPPVVTPGTSSTQNRPGAAPSDAIVLFDGTDLSQWESVAGGPAKWKVNGRWMEVVPKTGDIQTKAHCGDIQLHIEWRAPTVVKGESQGRGNSGVFLLGRYEIQVLDCYNNLTYPDGTTAAIYGQYPPLVNACRKPGEWQSYDIVFIAPRWEENQLVSPAILTVFHNGIVVHHATAAMGPTGHRNLTSYDTPHPSTGPLRLQDHGDLVRYRNIWVRPLKGYDEA
jgi:hypothetical protein